LLEGLAVHPGQHEYLTGIGVLRDGGDQRSLGEVEHSSCEWAVGSGPPEEVVWLPTAHGPLPTSIESAKTPHTDQAFCDRSETPPPRGPRSRPPCPRPARSPRSRPSWFRRWPTSHRRLIRSPPS